MNKQVRLLKETLIIKNLSLEKGAAYIGCSSRQIRRWFEGEFNPIPAHVTAIEVGIKKINREIPDDGFRPSKKAKGISIRWKKVPEIPEEERLTDKKLDVFFDELVNAARANNRKDFMKVADQSYEGFEEIIHIAKKLRVKLPVI